LKERKNGIVVVIVVLKGKVGEGDVGVEIVREPATH